MAQGELICLLGGSGSGKTTLLRLIAGFDSPSAGQIRLHGVDVSTLSPADREIGMVFQNYALFPHLTVARNIEYGLRMRGWHRGERATRVAEMVARMRLTGLEDRLPRQLSGGQQQRVAIARALAYSPQLLLMDEPLGALDKALKASLLQEIRRVHREFATTIIYVTHDQEEALILADRVVVLRESRMIACAPVRELYQYPPSGEVAQFFSAANLLPVTVTGDGAGRRAEVSGGGGHTVAIPPGLAAADLVAAVRPADVRVGRTDTDWTLVAEVVDTVFLGDDLQVRMELDDGTAITAVQSASQDPQPIGSKIALGLSAEAVRIIPRTSTIEEQAR